MTTATMISKVSCVILNYNHARELIILVAGRPSHDYDETDDILVAAVSSKKVKSELVKRRSLIRTLGTVLFVITISIALGKLSS